jgi:hypothetical protein
MAPTIPVPRKVSIWSERWESAEETLLRIEARLKEESALVRRGGPFDRWDFDVRGGSLGSARLRLALEEHGFGRQLIRVRVWPRIARTAWTMAGLAAAIAVAAIVVGPIAVGVVFGIAAVLALELAISHCRGAMGLSLLALAHQADGSEKVVLSGLEPVPASPLEQLSTEVGTSPRRGSLGGRRRRGWGRAVIKREASSTGDRGAR